MENKAKHTDREILSVAAEEHSRVTRIVPAGTFVPVLGFKPRSIGSWQAGVVPSQPRVASPTRKDNPRFQTPSLQDLAAPVIFPHHIQISPTFAVLHEALAMTVRSLQALIVVLSCDLLSYQLP